MNTTRRLLKKEKEITAKDQVAGQLMVECQNNPHPALHHFSQISGKRTSLISSGLRQIIHVAAPH